MKHIIKMKLLSLIMGTGFLLLESHAINHQIHNHLGVRMYSDQTLGSHDEHSEAMKNI